MVWRPMGNCTREGVVWPVDVPSRMMSAPSGKLRTLAQATRLFEFDELGEALEDEGGLVAIEPGAGSVTDFDTGVEVVSSSPMLSTMWTLAGTSRNRPRSAA